VSHIVEIKTKLTDPTILAEVCGQLGLEIRNGRHQLFSASVSGNGIKLNGWQYPIVVKDDGTVAYDNYGGKWGDISRLNELVQMYSIAKVRAEAKRKGYSVSETRLADGSVKLTIMA